MSTPDDALLPPLRARRGPLEPSEAQVDRARQLLRQAVERGELTPEQFAQTLARLQPEQEPVAPTPS